MIAYRVVNLGAGAPSGQTVSVPVLPSPPVHSLTEKTGEGLPALPLILAGVAIVGAIIFG